MELLTQKTTSPWEALDRFRTAIERQRDLVRQLERAQDEIAAAEIDAIAVFEANGCPPKIAIGRDIVQYINRGGRDQLLSVLFAEEIPDVHDLKSPWEPATAEVQDF